jgi:ABC-type spermidine/putrescine transport system permease subunit II
LNREVEEAALDLGATRLQTVRLVVLPALWPAITNEIEKVISAIMIVSSDRSPRRC